MVEQLAFSRAEAAKLGGISMSSLYAEARETLGNSEVWAPLANHKGRFGGVA